MALKPPVSHEDHMLGDKNALVELVEYGDYQCPYCAQAYVVLKAIRQQFGTQLKFVFRHFPLATIHPQAKLAAIASEAAGMQQKFWQMHDIIFENQEVLPFENIALFAKAIGLSLQRFEEDLHNHSLTEKVDADFESGMRSGVNGTPTFFINREKYNANWDYPHLSAFINSKIDALRQDQTVLL